MGEGRLDSLLDRGRPAESLDERMALSSLEAALFDRPPRPLTVSRYVLAERLGEGASGLVYRAYDPQLDRKVAVKLLQAVSDRDGGGADRLLAEAQALARLAHPNVVAVHDVGSYSELDLGIDVDVELPSRGAFEIPTRGVFIVMEFVEGRTMSSWLAERSRSWREVVDVFIAAGRGLAAAHDAGLVHRDFKPANVVVGGDGRVRVLDFGLAALEVDEARAAGRGPIAGTLAYMAPEQHRGDPVAARSDQYAFGVALFSALVGKLPFAGGGVALRGAKSRGVAEVFESLDRRSVPRHVRAVITRALQPEPEARFCSMSELIAALADDPVRRRRRWTLGLGGAVAIAAGALAVSPGMGGPGPCAGVDEQIWQAWDGDARRNIRARFVATGLPFAKREFERIESQLDTYARDWSGQRTAACKATRVRGEQSDALLDRRLACLDRRLRAFERAVGDLRQLDPAALEGARMAVENLAPLGPCADIDALLRTDAPPADPLLRAEVDRLYDQLGQVSAAAAATHFAEAEALAQAVVADADEVGYDALIADAGLTLADVQERRGDYQGAHDRLLDAIIAAERSSDDRKAVEAWTRLVWIDGVERRDLAQGEVWARFAEAALGRVGPDRRLEANLAHNLGGLRYAQGRLPEALASYQVALELQRELLGDHHPTVARTLNHVGNVLLMMEELERAFEVCGQSREIRAEALGPQHPLVAAAVNNQAVARDRQGRPDEALALIGESLEIVGGTGAPEELVALHLLGRLRLDRGERDAARAAFERMERLGLSMHHASHWTVTTPRMYLRELEGDAP